jgi:hypothetical protein
MNEPPNSVFVRCRFLLRRFHLCKTNAKQHEAGVKKLRDRTIPGVYFLDCGKRDARVIRRSSAAQVDRPEHQETPGWEKAHSTVQLASDRLAKLADAHQPTLRLRRLVLLLPHRLERRQIGAWLQRRGFHGDKRGLCREPECARSGDECSGDKRGESLHDRLRRITDLPYQLPRITPCCRRDG